MALSTQYYNGTDYTQFGLDVADYTTGGVVSNVFGCVKDSKDNIYIVCQNSGTQYKQMPIIKIDKNGIKTVSLSSVATWAYRVLLPCNPILSRDEKTLFFMADNGGGSMLVYTVNISALFDTYTLTSVLGIGEYTGNPKFAIYQDRYIWVASGTTVKIYDYTTKAELATINSPGGITSIDMNICCSKDNELYIQGFGSSVRPLAKITYNGISTLTAFVVASNTGAVNYKQLLIDRFGDLIILTNTGTASTLLKYTTAGVQVGATLSLGGAFYNLNTDKDGNYYYSNALGTYKITANTAQGQAFTGVGTKIRGNGLTTYGNNISGCNPAVFGKQE